MPPVQARPQVPPHRDADAPPRRAAQQHPGACYATVTPLRLSTRKRPRPCSPDASVDNRADSTRDARANERTGPTAVEVKCAPIEIA